MNLDLVLTDANVITMDPARPRASRIGIWNGWIAGVDEQIEGLDATRTVSLGGATVTPGFNDVHNHMATFGRKLIEVDAGGCRSLDELYRLIAERASETRQVAGWVIASGYDQSRLGGHPTRRGLDAAAPGHPVIVNHRTTHMLVASTPVFERLGALEPDFPVPAGGFIPRDDTGEPTGLVGEQAMLPFRNLVKPFSLRDLEGALGRASETYLSEGLTSVCEAGIGDSTVVGSSPVELAAYQRALQSRKLGVRTQVMVAMENLHPVGTAAEDDFTCGLDLGLHTGLGDHWLQVGPLKMFTDGALMSRTASLTSDFCDHGGTGVMQFGKAELQEKARDAHVQGWQLAIHAIGDHAVDVALDTIEFALAAAPRDDHRHRIEHASIVRPDQLKRLTALKVIPVPQGRFVYEIGDGVAAGVGRERMAWTYRHRSLLDARLVVPASSDRPVVSGAPLSGMQAMVERLTSSGQPFGLAEKISAFEALQSYTVHSAHATRQERWKGRITSGLLADLVVLGANPLTVRASEIGSIPIELTMVGGHARYDPRGHLS